MRRKKWIILGVCMLFCMINIAGCVKKRKQEDYYRPFRGKNRKEKKGKKDRDNRDNF